jgi:hypothetical protein
MKETMSRIYLGKKCVESTFSDLSTVKSDGIDIEDEDWVRYVLSALPVLGE